MQFIESIRLNNGVYENIDLHQARMDRAFAQYAPTIPSHDLLDVLPVIELEGIYKVRLVYDLDSEDAEYDIEFAEYIPRKIESIELVHSAPFDYSMKYADRSPINQLINQSTADDIIMVIDGKITDGSYFNVAFSDGKSWFTPDSYLLNGVRRQQLVKSGQIKSERIQLDDLKNFKKLSLINAMLDLGELELPISAIEFPKSAD